MVSKVLKVFNLPKALRPLPLLGRHYHAMPTPGPHTAAPAAAHPDGQPRRGGIDVAMGENPWPLSQAAPWLLITLGPANRWRAATEALRRAIAAMGGGEPRPELFAPRVCRLHGAQGGRPRRVEAPLLLNYAFLRATGAQLRTLRAACPEVNPVVDRASAATAEGRRRYVALSDAAVEAFRRIAAAEADNLPVYAPGEIDLTTADTVRVVDGPFRGIVGRIVRQRGTSACRIALEIGNGYFASTIRIEPRYIALEAFAPRPRAIYDVLDAYIERRLLPLLRAGAESAAAPSSALTDLKGPNDLKEPEDLKGTEAAEATEAAEGAGVDGPAGHEALTFFLRRFAAADPSATDAPLAAPPRLRAKLLAALYLTHRLLGHPSSTLAPLRAALLPLLPRLSPSSPLLPYLP